MNNEQKNMLKALQSLNFALVDTSLFLDTHPNNQRALDYYRKKSEAYMILKDEYTKKYGPFTMADAAGDSWNWVDKPWPWQNQEV